MALAQKYKQGALRLFLLAPPLQTATDVTEAESEAMGILSFTKVALPRAATRTDPHTCPTACRRDCAFLLTPLVYTPAELAAYNPSSGYPDHCV